MDSDADGQHQRAAPPITALSLGRGGRPPGLPKTGGRQKGTKNKRTLAVEAAVRPLLPRAKRALRDLFGDVDGDIRFKAAALIYAYSYGRPTERKELTGADGAPLPGTTNNNLFLSPEAAAIGKQALAAMIVERLRLAPSVSDSEGAT